MSTPAQEWRPEYSPAALGARIGQMLRAACSRIWAGIEVRRAAQRRRTLRVVETVAMGEKRFVAIVEVEAQRFLVGGGSAGVSLLARLDCAGAPDLAGCATPNDFASVLHKQEAQQEAGPASSAARIREAR